MSTQPQPLDKPTRRTIESLLRELSRHSTYNSPNADYGRHKELEGKAEAMLDRVRETKAYKKLKAASQKAWSAYYSRRRIQETKAGDLRRHYLANGITPYLIRELNKLIKAKAVCDDSCQDGEEG